MTSDWHFGMMPNISTAISQQINNSWRKRSSKIIKPKSRNPSPRQTMRRRLTTHGTSRIPDNPDQYQNGRVLDLQCASRIRPMSWNPSSNFDFTSMNFQPQFVERQDWTTPSSTNYAYGLVTPATNPITSTQFDCPSWFLDSNLNTYDANSSLTPTSLPIPDQADFQFDTNISSWPSLPDSVSHLNAPLSPAYLSMPDLGAPLDLSEFDPEGGEELVALGLYDSPEEVRTRNLMFSNDLPVRRKSLKLEESFQPTEEEEDVVESIENEFTQAMSPDISGMSLDPWQHQDYPVPDMTQFYMSHQGTNMYGWV